MRRPEFVLLLALLGGCATVAPGGIASAPPQPLSSVGRTHLGLAQNYLANKQNERALQRAEMALATDPNSADVHAVLALIYSRTGKADKAVREFERALKLAPDDGSVLNAYGSWLCEQGKTAEADAHFARALRDGRYRTPHQALSNAGRCALKAREWVKAEDYLRRALTISPLDTEVLGMLARAELEQGNALEARAFNQRREALRLDGATLELAALIEDAASDRHAAARYRQRLKTEFPNYVPTGEGARTP